MAGSQTDQDAILIQGYGFIQEGVLLLFTFLLL